jgi:peptide/nickel transport system permease protein
MPQYLTDYGLILVMFLGIIVFIRSIKQKRQLSLIKRLFRRPLAASTAVLLLFFSLIAVLDSLYLNENLTLLDRILSPLGSTLEKTYSKPLSLISYNKEIKFENGKLTQFYPKLSYPKQAFDSNYEKMQWISYVLIGDILLISICYFALGFYLFKWLRVKLTSFEKWRSSIKAVWLTLFTLTLLMGILLHLSMHLHVLGTGKIGQDIFYMTIKSIRTGMVIGLLTTLFTLPFALGFGIAAGYFGGWIDDVIQFIYTTLSSVPGVLLISASVLSLQTFMASHPAYFVKLESAADMRLLALCLIMGLTSWTSLCRVLRAEVFKLRTLEYVQAAHVLGTSNLRIILKHLLPNVMPMVITTIALDFSFLVLAEAVLSYVGVGVSPTTISWGNMINGARLELAREPVVWWPMLAAFSMMFTLVVASNLFADEVNKVLNPHSN